MNGLNKGVAYSILGACFIGQALLQTGLGPQPRGSDYETKTEAQKDGSYVTRKVLKNDAPKPAFQGLSSRWQRDYSPGKGKMVAGGLAPDQMLFALTGFREMVAGILWVRADSFFDQGNYDAILPIIRLVTILDPHQIDVYATGMWHIGYNFTDEEQRSDRRYIPSALALGKEGARNNDTTYEMFFETGWMWYHKIDDDYDQSVKWFEEAGKRADMLPARRNLLSNAYERAGRVDKSLETLYGLYDAAVKRTKEDPKSYGNKQNRDTLENKLDTTIVRTVQRGYIAGKEGRSLANYDVSPPFNVGFSCKVTVIDPSVLRFEGTWGVLPVGTRIRAVLRDADYPGGIAAGMDWDASNDVNLDPDRNRTFMQEQLFVKNQRFNKRVDMSKDPTMYPFSGKDYYIELYYNPRSAPPHIQDKFGYLGEGMTDSNFLNTEVRDNQRVVFARLKIDKSQILRQGEWRDKVPFVATANFKEDPSRQYNKPSDEVIIDLPSLRAK